MKTPLTIMIISDICLVNSGVGIQTRHLIDGLLKKFPGKYKFVQLGVAIKHDNYQPIRVEIWKDDVIIVPTKGYWDPDDYNQKSFLRSMIYQFKPDIMVLFNDPRFFYGIWEMADEIYSNMPLIYNHLWDNNPGPQFNRMFYDSCNFIVTLNKLTHKFLEDFGYKNIKYVPHAIDYAKFKPNNDESANKALKARIFGPGKENHKMFFYNSRNARRKMTAHMFKVFYQFWQQLPKKDVVFLAHTSPSDHEGSQLQVLLQDLCPELLSTKTVMFSDPAHKTLPEETLIEFYNAADATVCPAFQEGHGLSCLESLACGTPVIANTTGGLQDQIKDPETGKEWGVALPNKLNVLQGVQPIPYIYESYYLDEDAVAAFQKIYDMPRTEIKKLGLEAREWAQQKFNMDFLINSWDQILTEQYQKFQNSPYKFDLSEI